MDMEAKATNIGTLVSLTSIAKCIKTVNSTHLHLFLQPKYQLRKRCTNHRSIVLPPATNADEKS